jgi:hypothetical protein
VDRVRPRRSLVSTGGLLSHVGTLEPSLMSEIRTVTCAKCHRRLMLIDFYGQQLVPSDLRLGQDVLFPPAERGERVVLSACGAVLGLGEPRLYGKGLFVPPDHA